MIKSTKEVVKIEIPGKYGLGTKKEFDNKLKIDSIINKKTDAKTFKGYLVACVRLVRAEGNTEMSILLEELVRKYNEYEKIGRIKVESWKGKSDINIIKRPDMIIVITYKKKDQDSEPLEVKTEIMKEELNNLIIALKQFNKGEKIDTKDLAEKYCKIAQINFDDINRPLFANGKLLWRNFFAWRDLHVHFNLMLRALDAEGMIKYRGRKSEIIDNTITIQEVLN